MTDLPPDPLEADGIAGFGTRLRAREVTAESATADYLRRIERLEPRLECYEQVDGDRALTTARAIDSLLVAGTDLGPLMGVPVAIKDIVAVDGMPVTAGSNLDVADLIGPEGQFVKQLRRAGCVILGKTKTVEFAMGGAGTNHRRGTPWNPWDSAVKRAPGGSSSGSAVAMAAGLCGFSIGSDTGGSVRGPAGFCGIYGIRPTAGTWPLDGVFPLSVSFDTIGPFARSADDMAVLFAALTGQPKPRPVPLKGARFGKPSPGYFEDMDPDVTRSMTAALAALEKAGAEIVPVDLPDTEETWPLYTTITRAEFIATMGRERYEVGRAAMNPDVAERADGGLSLMAEDYVRALRRRQDLCWRAVLRLRGLDALLAPAKSRVAAIVPPGEDAATTSKLADDTGGPTRPLSTYGLCGISVPVHDLAGAILPVGMQVAAPAGSDGHVIGLALAMEALWGPPSRPDLTGFLNT